MKYEQVSHLHNDEPTLLDALDREPLIREVGEAIAHCTPPQVFGVHGDWGLGKTSFLHHSPWQNLDFSGLCSFRTLALRWPNDGFQERKTANRAGTTPRNAPKGDSWLSSAPLGPK